MKTENSVREKAGSIWQAGVKSADPLRLINDQIRCDLQSLQINSRTISLAGIERIYICGAGKAAGCMSEGIEQALTPVAESISIQGQVIVPFSAADQSVQQTSQSQQPPRIKKVVGRDSHVNLPTELAQQATRDTIQAIAELDEQSLLIMLISGGGSALLTAPIPPITLQEKNEATKFLAAQGADIGIINTVRGAISQVKNGRLLQSSNARQSVSLILSDVMHLPPSCVASGPSFVQANQSAKALDCLVELDPQKKYLAESIYQCLENSTDQPAPDSGEQHLNVVIGDHVTALTGAEIQAQQLGYQTSTTILPQAISVNELAGQISVAIANRNNTANPQCLLWVGEPVLQVDLTADGKGGRAQQLALEVIRKLKTMPDQVRDFCLLAAGTDGEDGPTDAAGAIVDAACLQVDLQKLELHLQNNNAYPMLESLQGLFKPGITGTNVCDLYVLLLA